jgi:hypothetical protein
MPKLEIQHKHILKLIARDCDEEGWAAVSETLYPYLSKNIPAELAKFEKLSTGGRARLTEEGQNVINAMEWLD